MKFEDIRTFELINETSEKKVNYLVNSILNKGYKGSPILVCNHGLVTGSHRIQALKQLEEMYLNNEIEIDFTEEVEIEDVSDIIENYCEEHEMSWNEIDFSNLGNIFKNTRIEKYKELIEEW